MYSALLNHEVHVAFDPHPRLVNDEGETLPLRAADAIVESVSDTHVRLIVGRFYAPELDALELEQPQELTVRAEAITSMQLLAEPDDSDWEEDDSEDD